MTTAIENRIHRLEVWSKWLDLAAVCDIDLVAKYRPLKTASWQTILYRTSLLRQAQADRRARIDSDLLQEIAG